MQENRSRSVALVFAGGNALGAYQAGVFEAFDRAGRTPHWLTESSVGAVNAAIIAGNKPENRVSALREYWRRASLPNGPWDFPIPGWSRALHLAGAVQTRLLGRSAIFWPRLSVFPGSAQTPEQISLYDFTPLRPPHARPAD
jgi:NTE family protein